MLSIFAGCSNKQVNNGELSNGKEKVVVTKEDLIKEFELLFRLAEEKNFDFVSLPIT